jgi:phage terminase large subunit
MINRRALPVPAAKLRRVHVNKRFREAQSTNPEVIGKQLLLKEGLTLQVTPVYTQLEEAYESRKYTVAVLEGGSRSSKTHSIIQFIIKFAQDNEFTEKRVLVARQKTTWTAATVLHDFLQVLRSIKVNAADPASKSLFDFCSYNKTNKILRLYQTEIWFGGLDDAQKLHGFQSDLFWINEAVEATKDDFDQLEQRLKNGGFAILDYNPSTDEHWIYDNVCKRPDAIYIHSTMLHNPFISDRAKAKILSYDPNNPDNVKNGTADKDKWNIYGLGKRSTIKGVIYTNYQIVKEIPLWAKQFRHRFGLDWGYSNDPTGIVDVYFSGNEVWVDELCYETELLYHDIADIIKSNDLKGIKGYGDSSDPRGIEEVSRRGINIHEAEKPAGSVVAGITILKGCKVHVTERSINLITELKNYKWMENKSGKTLNVPIDDFNHLLDALRYVIYMEMKPVSEDKKDKLKKVFGR